MVSNAAERSRSTRKTPQLLSIATSRSFCTFNNAVSDSLYYDNSGRQIVFSHTGRASSYMMSAGLRRPFLELKMCIAGWTLVCSCVILLCQDSSFSAGDAPRLT